MITREQFRKLREQGLGVEEIVALQKRQKAQLSKRVSPSLQLGIGAAKGIGSTLFGLGKLGAKLIPGKQRIEEAEKPEFLKPQTGLEKIGFGVEQIAEFLVPGSAVLKLGKLGTGLVKGVSAGAKVGRLGIRAGIEGVTVGGVRAAQKGEIDNDVKTAAIIGTMFPVAGAALRGLKKPVSGALKGIGEKIQTTVIRPTIRDAKDGFKIVNVSKYGFEGTLEQTLTKAHVRMNKLYRQLESKLKASDKKIDLNDIFRKTVVTIKGKERVSFGDVLALRRAMGSLRKEIGAIAPKSKSVDILTAQQIKRGAGTKGAWVFGNPDKDARAVERVYTAFYRNMREAIEKSSPSGIKEINKQISDIIPISNAVLRRLPIEQRNNVISVTDSIGLYAAVLDPRALSLLGASKLSKSKKFGDLLIRASNNLLRQPTERGVIGQRIFGQ